MGKHDNPRNPRGVDTGMSERDMEAGRLYLTDVTSDPDAPSDADAAHTGRAYRNPTGRVVHRKN